VHHVRLAIPTDSQYPQKPKKRHFPPTLLFLEELEKREMLAANAVESATAAFVGDAVQFRNDVATSALRLVNAVQSSPTNTPNTASVANQFGKVWSVLTTDWQQMQQAWMHLELAALSAYQQEFITLLTGLGVIPNAQEQALNTAQPQSASGSGSDPNSPSQACAMGGCSPVLVDDPNNMCNCGCTNEGGSLKQDALNAKAAAPSLSTEAPVRYADGVVTIAQTDLHSDGFGFPWGQTRSWSNGPGHPEYTIYQEDNGTDSSSTGFWFTEPNYSANSDNGNGWVDTYTPHLIEEDGSTANTLIYIANGNISYYYDLVNGAYQERLGDGSQLNHNSGNDTYTLLDTQGDQIVLDGFGSSWQSAQRGQFAKFISPGGETISVTSYTSDGHIAEMQRSATSGGNTTIESWLYSYLPSGNANAGLLSGVTERTQVNGGAWNIVRQVQYSYYDGTQTYGGSLGDLMTATVEDGSDNVLSTSTTALLDLYLGMQQGSSARLI
jgi:hypothetical protein